MTKRNKTNGKHTLESVCALCEFKPTVRFKGQYNEDLTGEASGAVCDQDNIIKVGITKISHPCDRIVIWIPINRVQFPEE